MDAIKEITAVFCAVCIFAGGLRLLIGKGLETSAKYMLSLLLLTAIVTSVASATVSFPTVTVAASSGTDTCSEALSRYEAEYLCARALDDAGVEYGQIQAKVTKTDDGSIWISEIEIRSADDGEKAKQAILATGLTDTVKCR